jgi:hypothetical protein
MSSNTPLYPRNVANQGAHLIFFLSVIFAFRLTIESIKKLGGALTLVTNGLHILGVLEGSQDFATHFFYEALFQDMAHINDPSFLGDTQVVLGILTPCITC